ncbi:MAG: DUF6089 family protein [Ferruginibacter sp.]
MKKFLVAGIFILVAFGSSNKVNAQYYPYSDDLYYLKSTTFEIGASLGVMNCFTDLGGKKGTGHKYYRGNDFSNSQVDAGIYMALMYKYAVGLRLDVTFGHVKASDETLEPVRETTYGRYDRNLSFKSQIIELCMVAEIHPRYFKNYEDAEKLPRLSPYLLGGIGIFSFKPQAQLDGQWIDLQPLRTEGQGFAEYPDRKKYSLTQLVVPVGIGIKYKCTPIINISLECASRILFTDYLDDVSTQYVNPNLFSNYLSGQELENALKLNDRRDELNPTHSYRPGTQRGNPANNDSYYTFNIRIAALL